MPELITPQNMPPAGSLDASSIFGLEGKVALITGGGTGIGAMIATSFADNGAKVYIASRKDISEFAAAVTARGKGECVALQVDLMSDESILALVKNVTELEPEGLDILINNSGTNWYENIETYSMEEWDKVYNVNVRSLFFLSQQSLPLLEKKASKESPARIVNVSSISGDTVDALKTFAYNSGKAAVNHLTRHMAVHLASKNITVNALCPGCVPSRMTNGYFTSMEAHVLTKIPLQRLGDEKDMAGIALFLCGRGGAWVTGQTFLIDGGQALGVTQAEIEVVNAMG